MERRTPGVRSLVLYEADADGLDRVVLATSAPEVVAAVERAIANKLASKDTEHRGTS